MNANTWFAALAICIAVSTSAETIDTLAGTGQTADGGSGGVAVATNIGNPFGVEVGPDGALYITEVSNHRVRRLDLQSGQLSTVAGNGQKGYSGDGGIATEAAPNEPYEVRFDGEGNMYFVEMQNHLVRKVDRQGRISTVAGTGKAGYGGDGGPALKAQFRNPHSIALDGRGGLYVADIGNHRIRRIDLAKGTIESIAGNGEKQLPKDGEPGLDRPILGPRALFISGHTLWIALREGNSVWKMNLEDGLVRHVAGSGQKGFTGDGGPAARATFNGPKGIAIDAQAKGVYVADTENQAIRRIDVATGMITTVAGSGPMARGYDGDGSSATEAKLNRPHGICVGPDGAVYIGDSENHRVRRVQ